MTVMWVPASEQDIFDGIKNDAIKETHFMEVKQSARPAQIAQTLASLAVDGGVFILGIAEEKDDRGNKRLVPQPLLLEGQLERVDSVARNSIEPPLKVRSTAIRSKVDPSDGYVVVTVEASLAAPHMVENKYYGRGEVSKHALSNAEVTRYHEQQGVLEEIAGRLLDEAEANDYLPVEMRNFGHLYLVAEPLRPIDASVVLEFLADEDRGQDFILSGHPKCNTDMRRFSPTPMEAHVIRQRESGISFITTDADGPGRSMNASPPSSEDGLLDIELTESGGIRVFIGRGTVPATSGEKTVFDGIAVAYTQRLLYWVGQLSDYYGYGSLWTVGVRLNGVSGLRAYSKSGGMRTGARGGTLEKDCYSRTCIVSTHELNASPDDVTRSLVGPLLRILGTTSQHLPVAPGSS